MQIHRGTDDYRSRVSSFGGACVEATLDSTILLTTVPNRQQLHKQQESNGKQKKKKKKQRAVRSNGMCSTIFFGFA
jgi:hypothetical protein